MPRLPTYDGSQVETAALPGFRQSSSVSPALLNAGNEYLDQMGRGLQQLGAELTQQEVEKQRIRDADMVNRAELAFAQQEQDYLSELSKQQGMNAWGAKDRTEKWAKERFKEHSAILENDTQRKAFEARFGQRAIRVRGLAMDHEDKEQKRSYLEARTSQLQLAVSDAAADIKLLPQSMQRIDGVMKDLAEFNQWDADTIKAKRLEATTMLHTQVMQGMDEQTALDYFNKHKEEIDGSKHAELSTGLKDNARKAEQQHTVEGYMTKGLTRAQALDEARKSYDGKEQDQVFDRINYEYDLADKTRKESDDKALDPIRTVMGDALQRGRIIPRKEQDQMLKDLRVSNPGLYQKATEEIFRQNKAIEADNRARATAAGDAVVGGPGMNWVMIKASIMQNPAGWGTPEQVVEALKPYVEKGALKASHVEEAIGMVDKVRKNAPKFATLTSADEYLQDRLRGTIINGQRYDELKADQQKVILAQARQAIDPLLQQFEVDQGDLEKIKPIIDSVLVQRRYRDTFLGIAGKEVKTETKIDGAGAGGRAVAKFASQIPLSQRRAIEAALIKNGEQVNDSNILAYYNARPH